MAEAVGFASSIAGLASLGLQMVQSIKELKDFCSDVRTAPRDIQEFAEEVDEIGSLLSQLETSGLLQQAPNAPSLQLCFSHCERANKLIFGVASELQRKLKDQRLRTRLSFPLKKERLKVLTDKLERSKSSLSLACNVYGLWLYQNTAQTQEQLLRDMMTLVQASQVQSVTSSKGAKIIPVSFANRSDSPNGYLSRFLWDACVNQFTRGWKRYFRQYRIVSADHEAFRFCRMGDLLGLQRAICTGQIGVHDQTKDGLTLFIVAVLTNQMHIAHELHQIGASFTNPWLETSLLAIYLVLRHIGCMSDLEEVRRQLSFLMDVCGSQDGANLAPEAVAEVIMKPHSTWTARDIFVFFKWELIFTHILPLDLLGTSYDEGVWHMQDKYGKTLLHEIAIKYRFPKLDGDGRPASYRYCDGVLKEAVRCGSNLHPRDLMLRTPLYDLLWVSLQRKEEWATELELFTNVLQCWVAALAAAGVDLKMYGDEETIFWHSALSDNDFLDYPVPSLLGFTYGPAVTDWKVLIEHPGDSYAGQFWHTIENPEIGMPGTWIEPDVQLWDDRFFERQNSLRKERAERSHRRRLSNVAAEHISDNA